MLYRIEVTNRFGDYLGNLLDDRIVISEFESFPLWFQVISDISDSHTLAVGDQALTREADRFCLDGASIRGRRGEFHVYVFLNGNIVATGLIYTTGNNLTAERYQYMIQDLKRRLVRLTSEQEEEPHNVVRGNEFEIVTHQLEDYKRKVRLIAAFLERLRIHFDTLSINPHHTVEKEYYWTSNSITGRIDLHAIRQQINQGHQHLGQRCTYRNSVNYDVYENQFLKYILERVCEYLNEIINNYRRELERAACDVQHHLQELAAYITGDADNAERRRFRQARRERLLAAQNVIQARHQELGLFQSEVEQTKHEAQKLGELPFLKNVAIRPDLQLEPTLVLLEHPLYNAIYHAYQNLAIQLKLSDYDMIAALLEQVPVARTSTLYEYWVFVQVYEELKSLGFTEDDGSQGIWEVLNRRTLQYRPKRYIEMHGADDLYTIDEKRLTVRVYPQWRLANGQLCPDILIVFQQFDIYTLILDAKYRNDYYDPNCPTFSEDVEDVALHKYKRFEKRQDGVWKPIPGLDTFRNRVLASFIIHPQEGDAFIDYGSAGHANQYGGIPLIPEPGQHYIVPLRRLFTMFMRMHLNVLDICWSTDHPQPVKAQQTKIYTGPNRLEGEGEYYCAECQNYWWVNHCAPCGRDQNTLTRKIAFSAVEDNFFVPNPDHLHPSTGQPLLKCATCNQSYYYK